MFSCISKLWLNILSCGNPPLSLSLRAYLTLPEEHTIFSPYTDKIIYIMVLSELLSNLIPARKNLPPNLNRGFIEPTCISTIDFLRLFFFFLSVTNATFVHRYFNITVSTWDTFSTDVRLNHSSTTLSFTHYYPVLHILQK